MTGEFSSLDDLTQDFSVYVHFPIVVLLLKNFSFLKLGKNWKNKRESIERREKSMLFYPAASGNPAGSI